MNSSYDKRFKTLVITGVAGIAVLLLIIFGVFLFKQREVAPDDSDAAVEPTTEVWINDIWKKDERRVRTNKFTPPANFTSGTVKIESYWGWSAGDDSCEVQMNESHTVSIPGLNNTVLTMRDLGNGTDQANCTEVINSLKALGYTNEEIGPFTFPHVEDGTPSTWFSENSQGNVTNQPQVVTGEWDASDGDLEVTITFTGLNGPPEEWCSLVAPTGTQHSDPICNGSHKFKIVVTWNPTEPTATPTATLTPTPTLTVTPTITNTPIPEKANLGDFVWDDRNKNGVQDDAEPGLANVTVKLFQESGTEPIATTMTNTTGNYSFLNLTAGKYYLMFESVEAYARTEANQGGNNDIDSDANISDGKTELIDLEAGETDNSWDAGYYQLLGKIGDCVWEDTNKNGIQDDDEDTGVPGVTVGLYSDASDTTPLQTDTTDNNGCYLFDEVASDTYVVKFNLPVGYAFSPVTQGSDTCKDSDANVTTGYTGNIDLDPGETDLCWDAGLYRLDAEIQIIKSEIADHANAVDYQIVASGSKATFHIKVTNTGQIDLENVVVTDEEAPGCARDISSEDLADSSPAGVLKVDQVVTYSCQSENVSASFTNVSVVEGDPIDGRSTVTDEDDSDVVLAGTPAIKIQKSEQADHSTAKDTQTVEKGDNATFFITVTNIGEVDLKTVSVTDPLATACAKAITQASSEDDLPEVLEEGESVSYECETIVNNSMVNVATVKGYSVETDEEVQDEDPTTVVVPGNITVNKTSAAVCQADSASVVTYTVEITNPTSDNRTVVVTDILDDKIDNTVLSVSSISNGGVYNSNLNEIVWSNVNLVPNETKVFTYNVTVQNADFGQYVNTVIVKQDGVEVGRDVNTTDVICLPATGILSDNTARIVISTIVIVLGITFFALKGHLYVGRLLTRGNKGDQIFDN